VPAPKAPVRRTDGHAWLITAPLLVVAVAVILPLVLRDPASFRNAALAPVFVVLITLASLMPLRFDVRRQGFSVTLSDVPLLLALFYLSPLLLVAVRLVSSVLFLVRRRYNVHKVAFNAASQLAGTALAALIVSYFGDSGVNPRTWAVLSAAVTANTLVTIVTVGGVIVLLQGRTFVRTFLRSAWPGLVVLVVNVVVGLVMLLTLDADPWSAFLLAALAIVLGLVYRAYAQFLHQHQSLAEMYAMTRALGATAHDGTLADVLLTRLRALMQAESATMWLPAQGRHPEVLLSARVDYPGLLDSAPTPDALRTHAVEADETVAVGPKTGSPHLFEALQEAGVKDAIVAPLHSRSVVIGTLEVGARLGDRVFFGPDDVRLLETLAAHAGLAVENARLVDRLQFDANHDLLTALPNRRRMLEALREALSARAGGEVVAVLLFDVAGLRQVNDSLGHPAGDRVLIEVARRLQALVPPAALVARVGGDEFAVELRAQTADAAVAVAESLQAGLRDRMVIDELTVDVDTSVGVAVHPDHGNDPETLLQRAAVATHAAKARGNVLRFSPALESRSVRRLGLAEDLRSALDAGELEVYFQPKVALRDRRLVGVECLARWEHPVHGPVSPPDFVAVAEHTGQLTRLTEVVLREGLRRAREWTAAGRSLSVAVNIAARTLTENGFPDQVAALLAEYEVAPARLTLEISESGVISSKRPLPALNRLRDLGVQLSIDDFGTGQSSLAHLHQLPVQEIKIDRTFVQGMATDAGDLAIVRTAVDMARHFGRAVVAEGVESELTLGLLEEIGCDMGQGFLFSRPLPYERLDAWLHVQEEADPAPAGEVRWLRAVP
jgi:diguanylate cyclase (GGDEF)-like protein